MNVLAKRRTILKGLSGALALGATGSRTLAQGHGHMHQHGDSHGHDHGQRAPGAAARDLGIGAAFDHEGRLWIVAKQTSNGEQYVTLQSSSDLGASWSSPKRIQRAGEPVAASGEARPHIAFGSKGEIYISYTSTVARPHIGDIRFVRSLDRGQSFSDPVTVHANRDVIVHSFESMAVDRQGRIYIAWIDGRGAAKAKQRNEPYAGSAVYYAISGDRGRSFKGDYKVADHACECCRIGLALDPQGKAVAMWRHVFAPNIRDHAVAVLAPDGKASAPSRVTFDDWRVDACPHHGPSLAYGSGGTRHQVWFSGKEEGGGAFYAAASAGETPRPVELALAPGSSQASYPDVAARGRQVAVAWKEFDGQSTAIVARLSNDGGATWTQQVLGRTSAQSDKPYLVTSPEPAAPRFVLVWRTLDEGIRVIPLFKEKA